MAFIQEGAAEMAKKFDLALILTPPWLFLHRIVLRWSKQWLGLE